MKLESSRVIGLDPPTSGFEPVNRMAVLVCLSAILLIGVFLRLPPALFSTASAPLHLLAALHPNPKWYDLGRVGPDERLYRDYITQLGEKGLGRYPEVVREYIEKQTKLPDAILPPTRFLYVVSGYLWHSLFQVEALTSIRNVSSLFSILTLGLAATLAWRMRGPLWSLALTALVAVAPTQIHMSQHALVDSFFSFWALLTLWMLWENLQSPRQWGWLAGYTIALAFLVLAKENAFFVWIAIVVILAANRWLHYGRVCPELLIATIVGPLLGIIALSIVAGGADVLMTSYQLFFTKNYALAYMIKTGDGPWHRYLLDLFAVSPVITILAIGALFRINRAKRAELFLIVFLFVTYVVMCNLKYGMNLRFGNMWDVPLRFLAVSTLTSLVAPLRQGRNYILAVAFAIICALELRQYLTLFVEYPLHELASEGLLRALSILK